MMNVFDIDELVKHIYSFIPRKSIGPCMLVNRRFYKMIDIDYDQDSVAKNEDFFSLYKIQYSPYAVMHIAKDNRNVDMMKYLLKKGYNYNDVVQIVGFVGDETQFNTIQFYNQHDKSTKTSKFVVGLCEGMHIDLLSKYKDNICDSTDLGIMVFGVYKNCSGDDMLNKIREIIINYDDMCRWGRFSDNIMAGVLARRNINTDEFKNAILNANTFNNHNVLIDGIIYREDSDMFEWIMSNTKMNEKYVCYDYNILEHLIKKNNYKIFSIIFLNYFKDYKFGICGKIMISGYESRNSMLLVRWCIDYRRIDILELVLSYTYYERDVYDVFFGWANDLGFMDVGEIIRKKIDI